MERERNLPKRRIFFSRRVHRNLKYQRASQIRLPDREKGTTARYTYQRIEKGKREEKKIWLHCSSSGGGRMFSLLFGQMNAWHGPPPLSGKGRAGGRGGLQNLNRMASFPPCFPTPLPFYQAAGIPCNLHRHRCAKRREREEEEKSPFLRIPPSIPCTRPPPSVFLSLLGPDFHFSLLTLNEMCQNKQRQVGGKSSYGFPHFPSSFHLDHRRLPSPRGRGRRMEKKK